MVLTTPTRLPPIRTSLPLISPAASGTSAFTSYVGMNGSPSFALYERKTATIVTSTVIAPIRIGDPTMLVLGFCLTGPAGSRGCASGPALQGPEWARRGPAAPPEREPPELQAQPPKAATSGAATSTTPAVARIGASAFCFLLSSFSFHRPAPPRPN